jgi:hypothetical protein
MWEEGRRRGGGTVLLSSVVFFSMLVILRHFSFTWFVLSPTYIYPFLERYAPTTLEALAWLINEGRRNGKIEC